MNKLTMLGTGHGFVHELYNTCFVINNNFLVKNIILDLIGIIITIRWTN